MAEADPPRGLPLISAQRPERADAARNREKVLAAARRLFAERGVARVTMAEVARAAGVGKGTVFHRFGDRAGVALALLDDEERRLQEAILRGPPPLGPGAPPGERLRAFLGALLEFTAEHADLLLAADGGSSGGRYETGAYAAWHQHAAILVADTAGLGGEEAALEAHRLLAPLAPDLVRHLRERIGVDVSVWRDVITG
jgi:AcrR family transcriptional regulator